MMFVGLLKSSYNDGISAIDDFLEQWDPSAVTLMENMYELQGGSMLKNKKK